MPASSRLAASPNDSDAGLAKTSRRRDGDVGGPAAADPEGEDLVAHGHGPDAISVSGPTALTTPATS